MGLFSFAWPTPQTKGEFVGTGANNRSFGGAPAVDAFGNAFQGAVGARWTNHPAPLLYPRGEQNLIGLVAVNAIAPGAIVRAKGSPVPTPLSSQPLSDPAQPWTLATQSLPGGGQGGL